MPFKLNPARNNIRNNPRIIFSIEQLEDPQVAAVFNANIRDMFTSLNQLEENTKTFTDNVKTVRHRSSIEVLRKERDRYQHYIANDILDHCDNKTGITKTRNVCQQHCSITM